MSITFYPTISDTDVQGFAGECHADFTKAPVQIGFAPTRDEAVERVAMHSLTCDECHMYGAYVSAITEVPEVNVSNENARFILSLLGVEFDYCGSVSAAELLERIAFGQVVGGGDEGTVAVEYRSEGGATMIECGRSAGYADRRLAQIAEVAEWAAAHGREVVWS